MVHSATKRPSNKMYHVHADASDVAVMHLLLSWYNNPLLPAFPNSVGGESGMTSDNVLERCDISCDNWLDHHTYQTIGECELEYIIYHLTDIQLNKLISTLKHICLSVHSSFHGQIWSTIMHYANIVFMSHAWLSCYELHLWTDCTAMDIYRSYGICSEVFLMSVEWSHCSW